MRYLQPSLPYDYPIIYFNQLHTLYKIHKKNSNYIFLRIYSLHSFHVKQTSCETQRKIEAR